MKSSILSAALLFLLMTFVTGVGYPIAVTLTAQITFPNQAGGSLVHRDGVVVGSSLVGQQFDDDRYFWSRPSATAGVPYDAAASAATNLGPSSEELASAVRDRVTAYRSMRPVHAATVAPPIDLVTASASGLDPHISPAAAYYQIGRVAHARGLPVERVKAMVDTFVEGRDFGVLGEPRVNVLLVNLALDDLGATGS